MTTCKTARERSSWKRLSLSMITFFVVAVSIQGCAATEEEANADDTSATASQKGENPAKAEEALGYPGGSWTLTCPDRTVRYDSSGNPAQIIAYCYNRSHKLVYNGVWVWDCNTGCFWNNNGKLTCGNC